MRLQNDMLNSRSVLTKPELTDCKTDSILYLLAPNWSTAATSCPSAKITSMLIIIQTFVPHRNSPLTPPGNKSKIEGKCNMCHISSAGAKQSTLTKSKVCSRKYNETHSISLIPQMALTVKHYSWLALSAYD